MGQYESKVTTTTACGGNTIISKTVKRDGKDQTVIKIDDDELNMIDSKEILQAASQEMIKASDEMYKEADRVDNSLEKSILKTTGHMLKVTGKSLEDAGQSIDSQIRVGLMECDNTCSSMEELKKCYREVLFDKPNDN